MRALEFQSTIENDHILIPTNFLSVLKPSNHKNIRVIVFVDDSDFYDTLNYKQVTNDSFLRGYSDSDSIYDSI